MRAKVGTKKDGTILLNVPKRWADSEYGKPYSKKKVNLKPYEHNFVPNTATNKRKVNE